MGIFTKMTPLPQCRMHVLQYIYILFCTCHGKMVYRQQKKRRQKSGSHRYDFLAVQSQKGTHQLLRERESRPSFFCSDCVYSVHCCWLPLDYGGIPDDDDDVFRAAPRIQSVCYAANGNKYKARWTSFLLRAIFRRESRERVTTKMSTGCA